MPGRFSVAALASTPIKGTRIMPREELLLGPGGALDDRRFYLVDERGWMVNGKQIGALSAVVATYDPTPGELGLTFAGGAPAVTGKVALGASIPTRFFSRPARARLVDGPWSAALSAFCGRSLRLVAPSDGWVGVDRGRAGGVTLVSSASIARLASVAGAERVDARRFRMLIEVAGVAAPHAEDGWRGRELRVGEAVVRVGGHVGRCLVTTRDPDTGQVDLPVLDLLRGYRGGLDTTEPLALGVYGSVVAPGRVWVGAPVALV